MSGSALSGVVDYFLTNLPTYVHAVDPQATIQENYVWTVAPIGTSMVVIGGENPASAAAGEATRQYMELGSGRIEETFSIPCYIDCATGGTDQSTSRRQAWAIFDQVVALVRTDLTFGGLLHNGRVGELNDISGTGTRDEDEAADGRRYTVTFKVTARNFY